MMKKLLKVIISGLLISISLLAQADNDHDRAKQLRDAGDILSLEAILENARKLHEGKILEAELETKKSTLVYEIELLTPDGKILELVFDAKSGQHISTEKED